MLWLLISGFFCWLIFREFRLRRVARPGYDRPMSTPVSKGYIAVLLALALAFAWTPFRYWRFEKFLTSRAAVLTEGRPVKVHCNTVFDTFFDREVFAAGHANIETGQITFQHPFCGKLMNYLADPAGADRSEIFSLQIFTHESMHVRGERNEAATECQAVQRNFRVAVLLGVPERVAKQNALDYYRNYYLARADHGPMSAAYFSPECKPGGALDERLSDSTWNLQ